MTIDIYITFLNDGINIYICLFMYRIIWKDISEIDNLLLRRTGYLGLGLEGKCIFHGISLGGFFGFVSNYFMYYLWQKKKN